ncbi:hypothetical protein MY978_06835 [Haemophilus influenzae]|uniref:hypothetical protein n=1 Tax=Haemophilus influenzae TaxID=727 RepID=UPI0001DDE056|nr:hypothetical protein [Haemophilus influenzae]CVQ11562.1 Uncharacterised protein [Streptococcus pneumoniae]TWV00832.1 hypothetical protein FRC22_09110 [Haemophilus influenzae]CBW28538.1 putative uncharacterized protein [Haemophilus influenzae 10810]CWW94976.1 phage protein [Haemophilus influenzae]CWX14767.1 phage protein [Haemophilus influenzae]
MPTQTTPFQGTKFYLGTGLTEGKAVTAVTVKPNATITATGHGAKAGDFVKLTGLGSLDGYYPVKSVTNEKITLADEVDWSNQDAPTSFTTAKVATVKWSSNFCAIKNIEGDGDTLGEEDITTMCSEGTETEAGEIEYGSIKLTFFYAPATPMQQDLRKKFYGKETFPWMMGFKNNQGSLYGTGFIQTSQNWSGEVKGKFDSGVTIKKAKRDYHLPA